MLADDYQECIEIAIVPTLASLLVPMSFAELYLTLCYTMVSYAIRSVAVLSLTRTLLQAAEAVHIFEPAKQSELTSTASGRSLWSSSDDAASNPVLPQVYWNGPRSGRPRP